ncbi:hypothetical protein CUMW_271020 [Citrus unshiu]|uniref:Uncharacterized protein n=1 Tax=Citrus unshiu TaxID=55188 RepID=A0A2H5QXI1_CITUN|nr:hypothetical protein CUMW_271020 [Citrus unshiu]
MPKSLIVWLSEVLIRRTITIKGSPRLQNPRILNFIITQFFLDNVLPASVVNEPWKHVFPVVTNKMNLDNSSYDYNGPHIDAKAVEDYKLVFEFLTCPCVEACGVCFYLQRSYFGIPNTCRY